MLIDQPLPGKLPVAVAEVKRMQVGLAPASKYSSLEATDVTSTHSSLTRLATMIRVTHSSCELMNNGFTTAGGKIYITLNIK